jgi:diketogulonate reductase-like aldo/keto reductase/enamine deaminase RidA (YjgF/YER057c/UK114 family)
VRAGLDARRARLGVEAVDLLQLHWWTFEHPAWLDALHELACLRDAGLIRALGVTNFDAAHLHLALADGVPLATNQVSFSLIDRRAAGPLAEVCAGGGPRLLAYGTLCGGFLTDRWRGRPRPEAVPDWSGMKYLRFIDAAGGWDTLQAVLEAAGRVAARHGVSIANVATRWVLDHPAVAAVIVGARLGEREHRADTRRLFAFALDDADRAMLEDAFAATRPIPGDCGDEYRRPPYLTASGDLSHHLDAIPSLHAAAPDAARPDRARVFTGSAWEPIAGYARALRDGRRVLVSGTTATHGADRVVAPHDAGAQATYVLDKIAAALRPLGAGLADVVRTRMYLVDERDAEAASRAHGRAFAAHPPANTTFVVGGLIGGYRVEIEAEAVLPPP